MDLSKPHYIFGATWLVTFLLASMITTNLSVPFPLAAYALVFGTILIFFAANALMLVLVPIKGPRRSFPRPSDADLIILSSFIRGLFLVWLIGFLGTIVYSQGIPIYWRLVGDSRNYLDFGMPTVSGLFNMFRAFIVAGCSALIVLGMARRTDIAIGAICVASAFAEISRGSIVAVVLHGAAMVLLFRPVRVREVVGGLLFLWVSAISFEYIGNTRTADYDVDFASVLGESFQGDGYWSQYIWTFIYITSPFNNLAYAIGQNLHPTMVPYYTLQPLVPTAIRDRIFAPGDYPIELINEAFNATTAYAPLIADFGPNVGMVIFAFIALLISYSYVSAKRGSLFNMLVYPALFTSVALSFFYAYFFALPIVLYPTVAMAYMIYRRAVLRRVQAQVAQRIEAR